MSTGAVVARILTQYSDKGSKQAQKDIAKLGKRIDAFGKKATKAFAAVGVATAAMAVKIGTDAVKAAIEENRTQQVLANTLRNVAGATDATIKRVDEYIDKQEMLSTVSDSDLRASFGRLVSISGDVTEAMRLQTVALDVAAGTTKDFNTVSAAFEKASAGNFTALKKVLPGIDANIIANKDLGAALEYATTMYGGSAKAFGDAEPLKRLQIAYGRVLEALGGALLPVVIEFTEYLTKPGGAIDAIKEFVEVNEKELQKALRDVASLLEYIVSNGETFTRTLSAMVQISRFLNTSILGIVRTGEAILGLVVILKVVRSLRRFKIDFGLSRGSVGAIKSVMKYKEALIILQYRAKQIATAIGLITTAFRAQGIAAGFAAIATALATGGVSLVTAGTALAAIGVTALVTKNAMDMYAKSQDKAAQATWEAAQGEFDLTKQKYGGAAATKYQAEVEAAATKARIAADKIAKAAAAKAAAEKKKQDAIDAKTAALKASIEKKYGVKITDAAEYENIQLDAVQKLQAKQKDADASLAKRIDMRKQELALFAALNANAQRYTDLLAALADNKLSDAEIELLAKKWGLTVDAAKSYIFTIFAIKDEKIDDDEVAKLAAAWGISKAQAAQYLDFFAALNDGKLSDAEIAKLMAKWNLTKEEAKKYADFVYAIGDGKLDDKEIENLKNKWGLTTQQVVDYIIKIGGKVDASGTILSAGDIAALGWTNALNALNAYLAALGKGTGGVPTIPPVVIPPVVVIPKPGDGLGNDNVAKDVAEAKAAAAAAASKKAADAYAAAKAKGDMDAAAKAAAGVTPSALAAQESGAIGAASIAAQLRAAEAAKAAADAAAKQASSLAAFKAKEAADLAASQAAYATQDYDEKFRMRAMQGVMSASAGSGFKGLTAGGNTNVTVNVAGSVTSENDLVATVRNGLLRGQINGQTLTLEAI
jgi:hypothetical protein